MGRLTDYELEQLAHRIKPHLAGWITGRAVRPVELVIEEGGDHEHSQYLTETIANALYLSLTNFGSHTGDENAHHNRIHNIIGADHTLSALQYQIVGATDVNTLGLITPSSNGSAGNKILITDANGNLTVNDITVNDLDGANVTLTGGVDAVTGVFTTSVDTALITSLSGTTGGSLQLDGDTEIILGTTLKADTDIDGAPSLQLNPTIGLGDFEIIQAKEAYFEALIAQVKWAEAGALIVSKSLAEVAEEFTVPAHVTGVSRPTETELIVNEFESLPGYDPIGGNRDDHIVRLHFLEPSGTVIQPVGFIGERMNYGEGDGGGGSPTVYINISFEGQVVGSSPSFFGYSGADNNTIVGADSDPVTVELDSGNRALFYDGGAKNAHLHYQGTAQSSIEAETGIVYTGRFKRASAAEGIGLLVADRYVTDSTDEYVRIRCNNSTGADATLNIDDHGQTVTPTGTTDSGYNPAAGQWHRFKIQFDDGETTASTTTLKARFWADGSTEPETWQIDAEYIGAGRPTNGTVGMWFNNNTGVWYDDVAVESLSDTTGTNAEASLSISNDLGNDDYIVAVLITESTTATITKPADFTLVTSGTFDTTFKYYVYRHQWQTGDDLVYTWSSDESDRIYVAMYMFDDVGATPTINVATSTNDDTPNPSTAFAATVGDMDAVVHVRTDSAIITGLSTPTGYTIGDHATDFGSYSSRITYRGINSDGNYLPSFFADEGDYIVLHIALDAGASSSTAFAVGYVHGLVEKDTDQTSLEDGQVRYKWWTLPNQATDHGRTVPPGALALDFGTGALSGKSADSFIELTTLDKTGAPYMRFVRMVTYSATSEWWKNTAWNPTSASLNTERIMQLGELKGLSGFNSDGEIGWEMPSLGTGGSVKLTDKRAQLTKVPLLMSDGNNDTLSIDENGIIIAGTNINDFYDSSFFIVNPQTGVVRIGAHQTAAGGGGRIVWDQDDATLTVIGTIEIESGSTGYDNIADGTTYGKLKKTVLKDGFISVGSGTADIDLDGFVLDATNLRAQEGGSTRVRLSDAGLTIVAKTLDSEPSPPGTITDIPHHLNIGEMQMYGETYDFDVIYGKRFKSYIQAGGTRTSGLLSGAIPYDGAYATLRIESTGNDAGTAVRSYIELRSGELGDTSVNELHISTPKINDWSDAGTVAAGHTEDRTLRAKKIGDMIFVTGRISKNDTNWTSGGTMFTLDVDYRPGTAHYYRCRLGAASISIVVNANGTIQASETITSSAGVSFDGVFWTTETV